MKTSKKITTTLLICCLGLASHGVFAARVDAPVKKPKPITLSSSAGFHDAEYIMGNYRHNQKLHILQAGSYELTLTDKSKKRPLKSLGASFAFNNGGKLGKVRGNDSMVFDLEPGLYNLSYFAKTYRPKQAGRFAVSLTPYENIVTPEPVPVPAAAWLFGSGLIGLAGLLRRRT